jgi:hypothetical protein
MGCFKARDVKPPGMGGTSSAVSVTKVPTKKPIKGGLKAEVIVQFRPNQKHLGEFGFDWVRLGDSVLSSKKADVKYTINMGYNYNVLGKKESSSSQIKSFKKDSSLAIKLKKTFLEEVSISNMSKYISTLDSKFEYSIPIITLMPKDKILNPYNVNLVAVLDMVINMGKNKPKSLRLGYKTEADEKATRDILKVKSMNISTSVTKAALTISSHGILKQDVILYIYADECFQPCGAVKILKNDKTVIKSITAYYIGVRTNIDGDKKQKPPVFNPILVRQILGQALINLNIVVPKQLLDMRNKFTKKHILIRKKTPIFNHDSGLANIMDNELKKVSKTYGSDIFSINSYRLFFLNGQAYSKHFKMFTGGGAVVNSNRTFYLGATGNDPSSMAHELGHCLGLKHTFNFKSNFTYEHKSTANIMDYSSKTVDFLAWQWKILNKGIN